MDVVLRSVQPEDWPEILRVAKEAVPQAGADNETWLANRRTFDASTGARRHHVAIDRDGRVTGYAAVEGGRPDRRLRAFVVTAPELMRTVGRRMFDQLLSDARDLGAEVLWMRERADDLGAAQLATDVGLGETQRFAFEGTELVVTELRV